METPQHQVNRSNDILGDTVQSVGGQLSYRPRKDFRKQRNRNTCYEGIVRIHVYDHNTYS